MKKDIAPILLDACTDAAIGAASGAAGVGVGFYIVEHDMFNDVETSAIAGVGAGVLISQLTEGILRMVKCAVVKRHHQKNIDRALAEMWEAIDGEEGEKNDKEA